MTHWTKIEKDWRDALQVGDIIIENGKTERVIRGVTHWHGGLLHSIDLVILRCSWTKRCHTTINRGDLKTRKFAPTGARKTTMSFLDKEINADIQFITNFKRKVRVPCCKVIALGVR